MMIQVVRCNALAHCSVVFTVCANSIGVNSELVAMVSGVMQNGTFLTALDSPMLLYTPSSIHNS